MKRNNYFGVWQRCRVCGTVFPERAELQEHMTAHKFKPDQSERTEFVHDLAMELDVEPKRFPARAAASARAVMPSR